MLRGNYSDDHLTCLQLCERISINLEDGDQPHTGGLGEKEVGGIAASRVPAGEGSPPTRREIGTRRPKATTFI